MKVGTLLALTSLVAATSHAQVSVGLYTGDGQSSQMVDVGFAPMLVMVQATSIAEPPYVTSTVVPPPQSFRINTGSVATNRVVALTANGFTVGAGQNVAGARYHWVAFAPIPGAARVDRYQGDGASGRFLMLGFLPAFAFVMSDAATTPMLRTDTMMGNVSYDFSANINGLPNHLEAFAPGGLTLGASPEVNATGRTYFVAAWASAAGVETGAYAGDGVAGRIIPLTRPASLVLVKSGGSAGVGYRSSALTAAEPSLSTTSTARTSDEIIALEPTGFRLGTDGRVNGNGTQYHWVAFGRGVGDGGVGDGGVGDGGVGDGGVGDGGVGDGGVGDGGVGDGGVGGDAGATAEDGGSSSARFGVGCGCGSSDALWPLVFVLVAFALRARSR